MPVFNGARFLDSAIQSVLDDLPLDGELVVIDDCSQDASWEIAVSLTSRHPRAIALRNEDRSGISRTINRGIEHPGCPEYVAIAEHDDVVLPGRFGDQMDFLDRHPRVGVVASAGRYISPDGREFGRVAVGPRSAAELASLMRTGEPVLVPHPSAMFRRTALHQAGLYDPAFDSGQDVDLTNRIVYSCGFEAVTLPGPHMLYRIHRAATSFHRLGDQRSILRYVKYRNRCVIAGTTHEPYESWRASTRRPVRRRIRWWRHDRGAQCFRNAGYSWLCRRRLRAAGLVAVAAVLHPGWVAGKLRMQVGRP